MASINLDEVEYSEIITFLTVAQTRNMSIAAEHLCVTQPAVSKRIANLEKRYGLILFIRSGRKLQLTPAGRAFHAELLKSMEHLQQAFITAMEIQTEPTKALRLGRDNVFDIPLLYEIVQRFMQENPNVHVHLYNYSEESCLDLFNGKADIMICPENYCRTIANRVNFERIAAFQFCVLVSKEHPLASRSSISVSDLIGVPLTVARSRDDSPYLTVVREIFQKNNVSPRFDHLVQIDNLLFSLLSENGVGIASPAFWRQQNSRTAAFFEENIRVFPLEGETLPMGFIWRADEDQKEISQFLRIYREVLSDPENRRILDLCYS